MFTLLTNYLTVALRNLRKQRVYSLINIIGLVLSVTSALLLFLYVADELSYDRYHTHVDQIYRVAMDVQMGGEERNVAVGPAALAPTLADNYAEIEHYALIRPINDFRIVNENETVAQNDVFFASATVFDVFSFPLIAGDPTTALQEPHSIVIDERMATHYFPDQVAVGQVLRGESDAQYRVTGVMKNVTGNGHFRPQALVSIWDKERITSWNDWNWANYVRLTPAASLKSLYEALDQVYQTHLAERAAEMNGRIRFVLQPLTDIHFYSRRDFELRVNDGNMNYVYTFLVTALLLLFVACINYSNLATARSLRRAKEVGIRKALGSSRGQLVGQFLAESYLMVGVSLLLGLALAVALLPTFNVFTQKTIRFDQLITPATVGGAAALVVLLGLLAGGYPALFLSRFRPTKVLKGVVVGERMSGFSLRQGLVVFQFVVSTAMLISTLVVVQQLAFLNQQSLGFDPEQVIAVDLSDAARAKYSVLQETLRQHPQIQQITTVQYYPGKQPEINNFRLDSDNGPQDRVLQQTWVDHHFLATLNIPLLRGRNFAAHHPIDTVSDLPLAGVLVNETLVASLGWTLDDALGRSITSDEWQDEVIGVVADFHMVSLHDVIEPLVIRYHSPEDYMLVQVNSQEVTQTIADIQQVWHKTVGETLSDYHWLDQQFQQQYETDKKRGRLFAGFSALTVLISCLGLFGLASYAVSQRTKEIGVRKVLGASVPTLILLLVRRYLQLIVIALLIAVPMANYAASEWLTSFAYRTPIRWWFFAAPGGFILLTALLSVGQQTWRSARANPVDSLRNE